MICTSLPVASKYGALVLTALLVGVLFPLMNTSATDADPFRQTLTSVARNLHVDAWQITHRDVDLKTAAQWSVQKLTLHGGKQEGVDVIVVNNGKLKFTVV